MRQDISPEHKTYILIINDACDLLDTNNHLAIDTIEIEDEKDLREFFLDSGYDLTSEDDIALLNKVSALKVGESVTSAMPHQFNNGTTTVTFIFAADKHLYY